MKNKKPFLIITVGYPASGKTTLMAQIRKKFPELNIVNGDHLRNFLQEKFPAFHDANFSFLSERVQRINKIVKTYKQNLVDLLISEKQPVLLEGNHLGAERRKKIIEMARVINPKIKIIILYFQVEEDELILRYQEREKKNPETLWIQEWHEWRKEQMEIPRENEADGLWIYNQKNDAEILDKI